MKIGGENRIQWIRNRHWERMAKSVGIGAKFVLQNVKKMAKRIVGAAEEVASKQQKIWGPASIIGRIQKVIAGQVKYAE